MTISFYPALVLSLGLTTISFAGSATWNLNPATGDWNTAGNWTPALVPDEVATFGVSNMTDISISQNPTLAERVFFEPGASAYIITAEPGSALLLSGAGVTNRSEIEQQFVIGPGGGEIMLAGDARARALTTFTTESGGQTLFTENARAEDTLFVIAGSNVTAGLGGVVRFSGNAFARRATLIADGGTNQGEGAIIQFLEQSGAKECDVTLSGNAILDISSKTGPEEVDIGSLVGTYLDGAYGIVNLGSNQLTVGSKNLGNFFQGIIQDGPGGSGGSLHKIGRGRFHLTSANTYTGGTIIDEGAVLVFNNEGSATGSGPVQVNQGALGGDGTIGGPVTIGAPNSTGAFLEPYFVDLTIEGPLLLTSNSIYQCPFLFEINAAGRVVANGVTIEGNATFVATFGGGKRHRQMDVGTVLTVINNTAGTPINGTFSNLPEGRIFKEALNKFQATYLGGDGNDLTLTVVP